MPKDHYIEPKRIDLPFTFDVDTSTFSKEVYPISITIEEKMKGINIDEIPEVFFRMKKLTIRLQTHIKEILRSLNCGYFIVKIDRRDTENGQQRGILYNLMQGFFELALITDDLDIEKWFTDDCETRDFGVITNIESFMHNLEFQKDSGHNDQEIIYRPTFSMVPPDATLKTSPIKNDHERASQTVDDPTLFLLSRYYSILYSLTTPLSYFPKTTLTRFKNMCQNDKEAVVAAYKTMILSINELDDRHSGEFGLLKLSMSHKDELTNTSRRKYESDCQNEFIKKHSELWTKIIGGGMKNNLDDTEKGKKVDNGVIERKFKNLLLELKIREAQLQILMIFELVSELSILEEQFIQKNLEEQQKKLKQMRKRQSLVRRKKTNSRNRVVPTFLGMGINVNDPPHNSNSSIMEIDEYYLFINLNTLVDRICLWDTLLGRDNGSKDSSYGFIGYILVPFFNRKLPSLVKYTADKVKELNIKTVTRPRKLSKEKGSAKSTPETNKPLEPSTLNSNKQTSKRFNKTRIQGRKIPVLKKGQSLDEKDLLPEISLKRSKSNISAVSSKKLQKREVNMSLNIKSFTEINLEKGDSGLSGIFDTEMDKISNPEKHLDTNTASKVFETSINSKVASYPVIQATPVKPNGSNRCQILATPNVGRKLQFDQINKTPDDSSLKVPIRNIFKTPDVNKKVVSSPSNPIRSYPGSRDGISSLTDTKVVDIPLRSPLMEGKVISSPNAKEMNVNNEIIASSPVEIISSATRKRKRPGEPVQLEDSPFYNSALDEIDNEERFKDSRWPYNTNIKEMTSDR